MVEDPHAGQAGMEEGKVSLRGAFFASIHYAPYGAGRSMLRR